MFGVFIFWLHYIIAGVLLYHILRCIYVKGLVITDRWGNIKYQKSDKDVRLKHQLWIVLLLIVAFCIPVINILSLAIYLGSRVVANPDGIYYCKSIFTKEY